MEIPIKKGPLLGKQVQIFITDTCNLNCDGCPYPFIPKKKYTALRQQELNPCEWKKTTDYLYQQGIRLFCLIGGEPASYSRLDKVIQNITYYSDALVLLSTSGIHALHNLILRKRLAQVLVRTRSNKFKNGIAISFDIIPSSSGPKNSRELKAKQGLDFVKCLQDEYGDKIIYTANVMVNSGNINSVLNIQTFLEERGIFTNICTQQMKCFNHTPVFNKTHLPQLTKVALEMIKRKIKGGIVVNSVIYLSQLPGIIGWEKYQCWKEPQGSPVLDFAPNGNLRFCNWIGQDGPDGTPSVDISQQIKGNLILSSKIWKQSKKITKQLCGGCSWSRRDRNIEPIAKFNHEVFNNEFFQLDPTLPKLQNIWVQAQQSNNIG